ncbi:hypothetical protein [Jeotgalibacillus proteolyticus]|uniref:TrbC/VirB2 family protein n=1 Tax=Jeotgalibacillus proteolyticus TaxID=2082395 RepID=A0A2S5GB01_9BACL|nr:hypothetical protein [Jeotgalibacillus proteolyticus]PPA70170.1 hypothetical protein C4B60_11325 [Jeotgalibacillus proteolyticus]
MFKKEKITSMSFKEFMNSKRQPVTENKKQRQLATALIVGSVFLTALFDPTAASANAVDGMVAEKVVRAFDPVIQLVQALSYPVGLTMMLGGGLFMMIGNSERGLAMIQKAGMGYVLIQMLPLLMDLLVDIAGSM